MTACCSVGRSSVLYLWGTVWNVFVFFYHHKDNKPNLCVCVFQWWSVLYSSKALGSWEHNLCVVVCSDGAEDCDALDTSGRPHQCRWSSAVCQFIYSSTRSSNTGIHKITDDTLHCVNECFTDERSCIVWRFVFRCSSRCSGSVRISLCVLSLCRVFSALPVRSLWVWIHDTSTSMNRRWMLYVWIWIQTISFSEFLSQIIAEILNWCLVEVNLNGSIYFEEFYSKNIFLYHVLTVVKTLCGQQKEYISYV